MPPGAYATPKSAPALVEWRLMSFTKTIRSRSNKNIGDMIEEQWEITARTVIDEPQAGDPRHGVPPRLGIYEYQVKPTVPPASTQPVRATRKQTLPSAGRTRRAAHS